MARRQLGYWVVIAVLAAGCSASEAYTPSPATDETDVWFMQHIAGHLLQATSILDLAGERITRPKLARLADTINQQGQAHFAQLQEWLATAGWPDDPQQQPSSRKGSDLQQQSRVGRASFDLAFLKVMTARHRAGSKLAATELGSGTVRRPGWGQRRGGGLCPRA